MDGNSLRSFVLACAPGVTFLDRKIKTQGSCLYYAPVHLPGLHTVDGSSLLGSVQNKVRATASQSSSLAPPRKESGFCLYL